MGTPYSHAYISFRSESLNRDLIYEAVGSGVRFVGKTLWEETSKEVKRYELEICQESYKELMQWCIDNAGVKYAYFQNIGILIANLFTLKKNPLKQKMNCSEVVARILIKNGFKVDKDLDLITPKDVDQILASQLASAPHC